MRNRDANGHKFKPTLVHVVMPNLQCLIVQVKARAGGAVEVTSAGIAWRQEQGRRLGH